MSKASKIIIGLALLSAAIPTLGFLPSTKNALIIFLGLGIAVITYWAQKHALLCDVCSPQSPNGKTVGASEKSIATFTENSAIHNESSARSLSTDSETIVDAGAPTKTSLSTPTPFDATPNEKARQRAPRKKIIVAS